MQDRAAPRLPEGRGGAHSCRAPPQQTKVLKLAKRLIDPGRDGDHRAGLAHLSHSRKLRIAKAPAWRFQVDREDPPVLDPDRVGHSGDGAGRLHDRRFDWPPVAAIRNRKHEHACGCALGIVLGDRALDGVLGTSPAMASTAHNRRPCATRARARTRLTWSITPLLLAMGCQWRLNTSGSSTSAGPKTRWLDSVFALWRALSLFLFFSGGVGRAVVWVEKSPRATLAA